MIEFEHRISGYLVGNIWMPNVEAWKTLDYRLSEEDSRFTSPGTLRDHVLRATNDGDFRGCDIADGVLITVATIHKPDGRVYRRERLTPLERCSTVADMVRSDWNGPICDDETDFDW